MPSLANWALTLSLLPTDYAVTAAAWDYYFTPAPAIQVFNLFPTAEALDYTMRALKEYVGIAVYRLRGWQ